MIGILSNPKSQEADLSLLNINNFLSDLAIAEDIVVQTEDGKALTVLPNSDFLEIFKHKNWIEKKVNSPLESTETLSITLNEDYYIKFYSYEDYAMIYNEDTQEKYRYYSIPEDVYMNLQNYVLENGEILDVEPMIETKALSLNDIIVLSQKGEALSWSDFDGFSYKETGSGLYIRVYEIDELFSLWIGGGKNDSKPMYIYLCANTEPEDQIDIRTENVIDFIKRYGRPLEDKEYKN